MCAPLPPLLPYTTRFNQVPTILPPSALPEAIIPTHFTFSDPPLQALQRPNSTCSTLRQPFLSATLHLITLTIPDTLLPFYLYLHIPIIPTYALQTLLRSILNPTSTFPSLALSQPFLSATLHTASTLPAAFGRFHIPIFTTHARILASAARNPSHYPSSPPPSPHAALFIVVTSPAGLRGCRSRLCRLALPGNKYELEEGNFQLHLVSLLFFLFLPSSSSSFSCSFASFSFFSFFSFIHLWSPTSALFLLSIIHLLLFLLP